MKFLLLSGSPRGNVSTSNNLLEYLQTQLEGLGQSVTFGVAHEILRNPSSYTDFQTQLSDTDYFILAAPLYVDSLPSHVIEILRKISQDKDRWDRASKIKFIAIMNNGFPEKHQNMLSLDICRQFALHSNLEWFGGIPIGGGAILAGGPLEDSGGRGRNARDALDMLAIELSNNKPIPPECIDRINKMIIPKRMYLMMAHKGWEQKSEKNNVQNLLKAQPYLS